MQPKRGDSGWNQCLLTVLCCCRNSIKNIFEGGVCLNTFGFCSSVVLVFWSFLLVFFLLFFFLAFYLFSLLAFLPFF